MIWQVEIDYSEKKKMFCEIIRVWDILNTSDLDGLLDQISLKLKNAGIGPFSLKNFVPLERKSDSFEYESIF